MTDTVIATVPGEVRSDGRRLLRFAQALQDATVFRRARSGTYCYDCDQAPGGRCDDHACDLDLIAGYEQDARAIRNAMEQAAVGPDATSRC